MAGTPSRRVVQGRAQEGRGVGDARSRASTPTFRRRHLCAASSTSRPTTVRRATASTRSTRSSPTARSGRRSSPQGESTLPQKHQTSSGSTSRRPTCATGDGDRAPRPHGACRKLTCRRSAASGGHQRQPRRGHRLLRVHVHRAAGDLQESIQDRQGDGVGADQAAGRHVAVVTQQVFYPSKDGTKSRCS